MGFFRRKPDIEKLRAQRDIDGLIKAFRDRDASVCMKAVDALGDIFCTAAVEPLIKALSDRNEQVCHYAAEALSNTLYSGEVALESLIETLDDSDKNTRKWTASALGKIGDERAVEPLIKLLKDSDEHVRAYTALALGGTHDPKAVEPLIEALEDRVRAVRGSAANALGEIGDERAVEPLLNAFEDSNKFVRFNAIEALGNPLLHYSDQKVISALERATNDPDVLIRQRARMSLDEIKSFEEKLKAGKPPGMPKKILKI